MACWIMTETEFLALVDQVLDSIESQADDWASATDLDIETSRSGHVLTLVFDNDIHVVINSQAPMREIWVAARSGGFHFRWDGSAWRDTRDGGELFAALSRLISAQSGQAVILRP